MDNENTTLIYNETVDLEGQLFTDFFFGRYGYGSEPETDDIEHACFLALDQSISVRTRAPSTLGRYEEVVASVDRVQLALTDTSSLEAYRGHGVRLRGQLYPAHNGHHHSPVLLSVAGEPATIDLRNVHGDVTSSGNGTGFLLGNGGLIATAAHVVEDADFVSVTRGLYRQLAAVVAIDHTYDLAVLRINPQGALGRLLEQREARVRPLRWMMRPRLGEKVYAFGFPLRNHLPHSLNITEGLVSAEVGMKSHHFQMSAAIQPGNSGGPVYDEFGNLLGIAVESLEPAQTVNFCVHGFQLSRFFHQNGAALDAQEGRSAKIPAALLGFDALHTCVEVEVWTRSLAQGIPA